MTAWSHAASPCISTPPTANQLAIDKPTGLPTHLVIRSLLLAMAGACAIRGVVWLVGMLSLGHYGIANPMMASSTPWIAWDGIHYLTILTSGYPQGPQVPPHIAFFPLYPLLASLLTPILHPSVALLVVSNLCALAGLAVAFDWARRLTDLRTATLLVLITASWPGAVFFSAALTEGPFLLCTALVLWLVQQERFWWAAGVCALATALRPTGIALSIFVGLWVLFKYRPEQPLLRRLGLSILVGLVAVLGLIAFQGFIWHRYERFDAYLIAQEYWHDTGEVMLLQKNALLANMDGFAAVAGYYMSKAGTPQAWNRVLMWLLVGLSVYGAFRARGVPRLMFAIPLVIFLQTYLPAWGLRASSVLRYESVALPCFLLVAIMLMRQARPWMTYGALGAMLVVQLYYASLFTRGVWVG
jgi:hypothetical protein